MIRLSVTDLDSYLWWRGSEEPLEVLLTRLRREEAPNQKMITGRAFHSILEDADMGEMQVAKKDGLTFRFFVDADLPLSPIRELKGEKLIPTSVGDVTLVGVVDGMHGRTIHDYKLTERFDAVRYADSYQWRAYLHMFVADKFVYDVFVGKQEGDDVSVYEYHTLSFYGYSGMARDVTSAVDELASIVDRYLPNHCRMEDPVPTVVGGDFALLGLMATEQ